MPSLGGTCHPSSDICNPYCTTYKSEYYPRKHGSTTGFRPLTSQGFTNTFNLCDPLESTTYAREYGRKPQCRSDPFRTGTASGCRANKPHPPQSFMVWRFPSNSKVPDENRVSEELMNEKINQIHKRMCSSTYKNDYLGIPQGFQVHSAFNNPPDYRDCAPYSLNTSQRYSYQGTTQVPTLQAPTTRYGSNKNKHIYPTGLIPTSNDIVNQMKKNTTYDHHYNDKACDVVRQIRERGQRLEAEAWKKFEDTVQMRIEGQRCAALAAKHDDEESPIVGMRPGKCRPTCPKTARSLSRARPMVPECTEYTDFVSRVAPPNAVDCTASPGCVAQTTPCVSDDTSYELRTGYSPAAPNNSPLNHT
ncbi:uncharacterized protein LOC121374258 isoform X2 [Gigantopelta aegis]|nr:uncharacterized protein LOC121374258 isoform X2 [Gigantopelta aegis]XP_041357219.1 uncharacterized protein LOC121374258 isoform X2 [Gigantopelta aegis]